MEEVVTVTKFGLILKYAKAELPVLGLKAVGVKNISLKPGDEVIMSLPVPNYYKEELILLINRGLVKRIPLKNIVRGKRGNRGTPFLKNVKSNPYYFVKGIETNLSKLKNLVEVNILTSTKLLKINGDEFPKDTFENGIQMFDQSETIYDIFTNVLDDKEYSKSITELSKDLSKSLEEKKAQHPNSLIDELGDIVEQQTSIYDILGETDLNQVDDEKLKEDLF
ncbi:MAG: hypothetical protein K6F59_04635 [Gammaproteobacteria bacterium]|nr:hypothetical protein [Gammaproteobacteria bacterium]